MTIQVDSREHAKAIKSILTEFNRQNVEYFISKMYVGDYMSYDNPRLVIDRKQNLTEVCQNVCQDHERFKNELIRAREHGIKVIVLVEHSEDIKTLPDVAFWINPRIKKSPKAVDGERLYKILKTIQRKYGCEFRFCNKNETGRLIIEILSERCVK